MRDLEKILSSNLLEDIDREEVISRYQKLAGILASLGCTEDEIFHIINKKKNLLSKPIEPIRTNVDDAIKFGFTKEDLKTMYKLSPLALRYTIDMYMTAMDNFRLLDFNKEKFIKSCVNRSRIVTLSIGQIRDRVEDIKEASINRGEDLEPIKIGFTFFDIRTMVGKDTEVLEITKDTLEAQATLLYEFGYTPEEIKKMIIEFPGLLSHKLTENEKKLEFYRDIKILHAISACSTRLKQSLILSVARVSYLEEHDVPLDHHGITVLFQNSSYYQSIFGVNNTGVINLYRLDQELKEKRAKMEKPDA